MINKKIQRIIISMMNLRIKWMNYRNNMETNKILMINLDKRNKMKM